ncbi:MAG: histidine phosphatase family protein [Anaerolinea sp.]|nr:histidine phosphatase family protein [Anaerolinea sp.]
MIRSSQQWFIFRHGLATRSKTGYGDQILTAEVLPEGIPPVRTLAAHLRDKPYDFGACSELIRCQQTAGIVTEITGRTFVTDGRLNEQIKESYDSVRARVRDFVTEIGASPHEHVWICTHGAIIAALKHYLTKGDESRINEMDYIQPGELLVIKEGQAEVIRFPQFV